MCACVKWTKNLSMRAEPSGRLDPLNALPAPLDEEGGHEFPAAGDADLSEDVAQVLLRRVRRNVEPWLSGGWHAPSG